MSRTGSPRLAFNFMPVAFSAAKFEGGLVEFESSEQLNSLRAELAGTHVVSRSREGIACVPLSADADLRGTPTTFFTREFQPLTMRLVQEALLRLVLDWHYELRRHKPLTFVSRRPGRDLLAPILGARGLDMLQRLHVYPQYVLDSKVMGPSGRPGVVIGLKTRYEIDMTVAELLERGIDVNGLYVLAEDDTTPQLPHMDRYASRRTIGAIDSIDGCELVLRDAPSVARIEADRTWLECRRETFAMVLSTLAGADGTQIVKELEQATFDLLGALGRYHKTQELAGSLQRHCPLTIARDLTVTLEPPIGSDSEGARSVEWIRCDTPTFQFDQAGDKKERSVGRGLDAYGPFDAEFFARKNPRIAVVMPRQHKGIIENFMSKFLGGIPNGHTYNQGFARMYHLGNPHVTMFPFDGLPTDASAYRDACREALASGDIDLAFVFTSDAQKHLTGDASPYLVSKSTFMGQGVPVQEVRIETARLSKLADPLNSIALACYSKLGGIPFVIAAPRALAHELVIGIGSAHVNAGRLTPSERVVGITTVFNADGNYLLSNTSREADYKDYPRELLRSLTDCINDIKDRNAWQKGDEVRLVFHVFKPLKDIETTAVKQLVERLTSQYANVEFAFVHVSTEHEWVMFDRASTGTAGNRSQGQAKGYYVPHSGYAVPIGSREVLLATTGPWDMKNPLHGAPKPLSLKLHRESTFTDMEYLTRQAFRFTAMSWRRMYPSSKPVTISYSDLIADLLGHLRHVRNWNADIITTKLRSSRWFL
ncbi:argonaute/piwi family protein [Nocardia sp. SC052]|uniref:argonaute/piwi family protein n=1 Tax=Nocardia sichangensis TaxID=3385975 RepID=UPI00399FF0A7